MRCKIFSWVQTKEEQAKALEQQRVRDSVNNYTDPLTNEKMEQIHIDTSAKVYHYAMLNN